MRCAVRSSLAGLLLALAFTAAPSAGEQGEQRPGPQGPEEGALRRQLWLIPLPGELLLMRASVLRPQGAGPFPLVVINHGSSQYLPRRENFPMPSYAIASQWFLDRGYAVVLPLRPGHGETGGPYFEDQGRCEVADYAKAGLAIADSIAAAVDYMTAQSFVQKSGAVVAGHSAGGWGALALASRNPQAVKAVINFAGGLGGRADGKPNNNCTPDRLVTAAGQFGRTARLPSLWLYAENDSYFAPALSKRMYDAFRNVDVRAEYHLVPPIGTDGHLLIGSSESRALWAPIVAKFLAERR